MSRTLLQTIFALLLIFSCVAGAQAIDPLPFKDHAQEVRFQNLTRQLRCLVCQNENLADSNADLARDLRHEVFGLMQQGKSASSVAYSRAIANVHQVGLRMAKFMQGYDVVLSPTLAKPPVPLGLLSLSPESMAAFTKEISEFGPYTALYNVTGQPSMSVPLHWTGDGLPVGMMFSGRFGEDGLLFRLAGQLEKARPWMNRRPG